MCGRYRPAYLPMIMDGASVATIPQYGCLPMISALVAESLDVRGLVCVEFIVTQSVCFRLVEAP
jgi:hypothetical protein